MRKKIKTILIILSLISISATASEDGEREALARFVSEFDILHSVLQDAEAQTEGAFNFKALRADLNIVRVGVVRYLNKVNTAPRNLPPMRKDDILISDYTLTNLLLDSKKQ